MFNSNFISYIRNTILSLVVVVCVATTLPYISFAADGITTDNPGAGITTSKPTETFTLKNPLQVESIGGLVQNFIEIFSYIVILFAVLALVYVGLKFILVRGNMEEMKNLKEWLLWIVVGVAVVIGARVIIQVVINTLSASGTVDQGTIQSVQKAVNRQ